MELDKKGFLMSSAKCPKCKRKITAFSRKDLKRNLELHYKNKHKQIAEIILEEIEQ